MEVTVKFLSYYRILAGRDQLTMEIHEGATIADLMDQLYATFEKLDLEKKDTTVVVNQKLVTFDAVLKDKDEITLFYSLGGG